ncbi:MAG: GNAT family N-acetyltransferase [Candidatus Bathyarchaeia archaeon]
MGEEGFRVREFRLDDLNRVMSINVECLPENYSSYFYRDIHKKYTRTFLVAEMDDEIQGYIMCRIERGFSKISSFKPTKLCHVVSIAVRETYRRKGIATRLMRKAMCAGAEDYGASECYLEVRVSNEAAIKLYKSLGFETVKRNYGYYLDGEDAWVMAARIEGE